MCKHNFPSSHHTLISKVNILISKKRKKRVHVADNIPEKKAKVAREGDVERACGCWMRHTPTPQEKPQLHHGRGVWPLPFCKPPRLFCQKGHVVRVPCGLWLSD